MSFISAVVACFRVVTFMNAGPDVRFRITTTDLSLVIQFRTDIPELVRFTQ